MWLLTSSFLNHSKNIGVDPDEIEHGNIYDESSESLISFEGNLCNWGLAINQNVCYYYYAMINFLNKSYQHRLKGLKLKKSIILLSKPSCQQQQKNNPVYFIWNEMDYF